MRMIDVEGMLHVLVCRECGADREYRPYSWKFKGKFVPFMFCYNCKIVICEECLDTDHWKRCGGRRGDSIMITDGERL